MGANPHGLRGNPQLTRGGAQTSALRRAALGSRIPKPAEERQEMFVFEAAVVGAGTMGGQIAQTIAAAGIPVVLKDIDDALVQAGLEEARSVTEGQISKLAEKGKITAEQAEAQIEEVLGRITGATTYGGLGEVDFVVEAVPERMDI